MPPDPDRLRFFVDETSLGLGKVLAIARQDVIHTGHRLIPEVPRGALDDEWMPAVAERGLAVITRDKKIRTKHAKTLLYSKYGVEGLRNRRQEEPDQLGDPGSRDSSVE